MKRTILKKGNSGKEHSEKDYFEKGKYEKENSENKNSYNDNSEKEALDNCISEKVETEKRPILEKII